MHISCSISWICFSPIWMFLWWFLMVTAILTVNLVKSDVPGSVYNVLKQFRSGQSLSRVWLFATSRTAARQASLPVHHQLPEFTQTCVHWVGDAIQPSHPLLSPSPPTFSLSQHQGLFKWVSSSHQVAQSIGVSASTSVLPMNVQDWFALGWTGWISL